LLADVALAYTARIHILKSILDRFVRRKHTGREWWAVTGSNR
jgi:hypothetical protein